MVSAGRTSCAQTIEVVAAGPLPPVPNQIGALRMTQGLPRVAKTRRTRDPQKRWRF